MSQFSGPETVRLAIAQHPITLLVYVSVVAVHNYIYKCYKCYIVHGCISFTGRVMTCPGSRRRAAAVYLNDQLILASLAWVYLA